MAFRDALTAALPVAAHRAAVAMAVMLASAAPGMALAETITGRASAIDGNTLDVAGRAIRLQGVDAPDLDQVCQDRHGADYPCGQRAREALRAHLGDEPISCEASAPDEAGRLQAICRSVGGDVNAWMVRAGHAVTVRGADTPYADEDRKAWARRAGLWSGVFEEPAAWRLQHQRTESLREGRNRQVAKAQ